VLRYKREDQRWLLRPPPIQIQGSKESRRFVLQALVGGRETNKVLKRMEVG
jgi:hypothetical protein